MGDRMTGGLSRRRLLGRAGAVAAGSATLGTVGAFGPVAADAAAPNPDCSLIVPANPLSAKGLSTPFRLIATDPNGGPCNEANTAPLGFGGI